MAATQVKSKKRYTPKAQKPEEITINEKINDFVQKNRKRLLIGLIAVVVILAGFIIALSVREKVQANAFSKADELDRRYAALRVYIGSDDPDAVSKQTEISALLDDLAAFEGKNSGFAAAKVYCISAEIYEAQKNWADAGQAWSASAKAAPKSYLAPVSVFNAAVAAEERDDIESAIDLYTQALDYGDAFPSAARAQFAIGRLQESRNNKDAALEAYRNLVSKWPYDPLWANLAQSRIIVLTE